MTVEGRTEGSSLAFSGGSDVCAIWRALLSRLAVWDSNWSTLVADARPRFASGFPEDGRKLSDKQVFEGFATALLSGNTRWDRIAAIRKELVGPFRCFEPSRFAALDDRAVADIAKWFRERRAGSAGLGAALLRLRQTAQKFSGHGRYVGAHELLRSVFVEANGAAEGAAMLLGTSKAWKLPGFGVALAAEGLRLVGFDLCKPDRHVTRAVGSWQLVRFANWKCKGAYTPPQARPAEMLATMMAVRDFAEANQVGVSYATSVIWLAGAVSGARLTNAEFGALAR